MLTLSASDRFDMIQCGIQFHLSQITGEYPANHRYDGWSPNFYVGDVRLGWPQDFFFNTGTTVGLDFDVITGSYPISKLIRKRSGDNAIFQFGNRKPEAVREFSGALDGGRYGSLLGAIVALSRHTATNRRRYWTRETDVSDLSARGSLQLSKSGSRFFYRRANYSFGGQILDVALWSGASPDPLRYSDTVSFSHGAGQEGIYTPLSPNLRFLPSTKFRIDCDDFVKAERQNGPLVFDQHGGYNVNHYTYSNFDLRRDGDPMKGTFLFTYEFENYASTTKVYTKLIVGSPFSLSRYQVEVLISYDFNFYPEKYPEDLDGTYHFDLDQNVQGYRKYTLLSHDCNYDIPSDMERNLYSIQLPTSSYMGFSPLQILSYPGVSRKDIQEWKESVPLLGFKNNHYYRLDQFKRLVDDIHSDIRPIAALSANDCLANYSSQTNMLETLPDLPGMLREIKDISRFGHLIKEISAGNPRAITDAIDLMADGYLAYKYGVKPTISDIAESRRIATMYYEQMDVLGKEQPDVLYGKFFFRIPLGMPGLPGSFQVTVLSKMVLRSSPAGPLAYAISLDSVGMLPTLARVWDLVPFSFVVDWFTSLGDRFADIDHFVARLAFDVDYYVHTYKYEYILDPKSYTPFRCVTSSSKPEFRMFIRERSLYHPILGSESRFDFHPPRGLSKHLLSAGALLWSS